MFDVSAIKQKADLFRLAEMAGAKFRGSGARRQSACPLHGGDNPTAFNVWIGADGTQLYKCQTHESDCNQYGADVIAFVRKWRGMTFQEACEFLGGDNASAPTIAPRPDPVPVPKPLQIPAQDWQAEAWREVDTASITLLDSPLAQAARDFLTSRHISRAMWELYHLGFMLYSPKDKPQTKIPVIVIPWYDADAGGEVVTAIKYRVMKKDSSLRYFSKSGSKFDFPFGMFDAIPQGIIPAQYAHHDTLLLIEGELNCISVRQCDPRGLSVLSIGSEGSGDNGALLAIAKRYQSVYVWADDLWDNPKHAQRAKELRALVRGRGVALRSVKQDGIKLDANEYLKRGELSAFLWHNLKVECQASHL